MDIEVQGVQCTKDYKIFQYNYPTYINFSLTEEIFGKEFTELANLSGAPLLLILIPG